MSSPFQLFDYNVKLLGLLPLKFDFTAEANSGVRFETSTLKKVNKPSEDPRYGRVHISNETQLNETAIIETKCYEESRVPTTIRNDDRSISTTDFTNNNGNDEEDTRMVNEVVEKLKVQANQDNGVDKENKGTASHDEDISEVPRSDDNENDKFESEPADQILNEDHPARFLYKSYSDMENWKPDFLAHRLPINFLAVKSYPYFFKVKKLRFKPYGCEHEMEFLQMGWPIQLDETTESPFEGCRVRGWSGPRFNRWIAEECDDYQDGSSNEKFAASATSEAIDSSFGGDDATGGNINFDSNGAPNPYHRAFIQAEITPKRAVSARGSSDSPRGFGILISALVGGVWELEDDPENYTCKHMAEMRTVKEETLAEAKPSRYNKNNYGREFFYKRLRMQRNYWQCYLAGEDKYLVSVHGSISSSDPKRAKRGPKQLRLYDMSKIPSFIARCASKQRFSPWSTEELESRLYKSLTFIYDIVINAPVGKEFTFVKYNHTDLPVHDVDGSITDPYMLAYRQLIVKGLPTPAQPNLVMDLMKSSKYEELFEIDEKRKFTPEDIPTVEEKENHIMLTFESGQVAELFLKIVGGYLRDLKENDPAGCGLENLTIATVYIPKPIPPGGDRSKSWRIPTEPSGEENNNNNGWRKPSDSWRIPKEPSGAENNNNDNKGWRQQPPPQSWRNSNHPQQSNQWNNNDWRQINPNSRRSASWTRYHERQQNLNYLNNNSAQEQIPAGSTLSWRNSNRHHHHQQQQQPPNSRNMHNAGMQHNNRRICAPFRRGSDWNQN